VNRTRLTILVAAVWAVTLTLSIVFHSSDPGARGVIADVSFFTWLVCTIALIVIGAAALVGHTRTRARG
jgi:hypothetical protein